MNNRNNEGRRDFSAGPYERPDQERVQGSGRFAQGAERESQEPPFARGPRGQSFNRSGGEYYGGAQFAERAQSAGWNENSDDWGYEGGPERFGASGYSEGNLRASGAYQGSDNPNRQHVQQYGRQGYGQAPGQETYGMQRGPYGREQSGPGADYYGGRQGFGAQAAFGSEYNTYGRQQGYGEGSGYTRQQDVGGRLMASREPYRGNLGSMGASRYGSENSGGRGAQYGREYLDEGEMSGYRPGDLGTQLQGSQASGRYGTQPGQYGYGGSGLSGRGYRGVGPKNYTRSDERLTEEINERLTDDDDLDASEITVRVADCKVTLEGVVDQRWMKHRAEDIADACSGVREVDNRIQVATSSRDLGSQSRGAAGRTPAARTASTTPGTPDKAGPGAAGTPH